MERLACDLERSKQLLLGRVHGMQPNPLERIWPVLCFKWNRLDYWTESRYGMKS